MKARRREVAGKPHTRLSFPGAFVLGALFLAATLRADNALVEIEFSLKNIAIDGDRAAEGLGYGATMNMKSLAVASSREALMDPLFLQNVALKKLVEKRARDAIWGRTVFMHYQIKNMPLSREGVGTNRYVPLFECDWYRHRLDYCYQWTNGTWKAGSYFPTTYLLDTPSKAQIYGVGEAVVIIQGYNMDLTGEVKRVQDIESVEVGRDYKVVTSKHWMRRPVYLDLASVKGGPTNIPDKLVLEGRASLGDSVIETKRGPFWYPWDMYEMTILFGSPFPADVNISLKDFEDLDLGSGREHHFITQGKHETVSFSLHRANPWRFFGLRVVAAFIPLIGLKQKLWIRLLSYSMAAAAVYAALPSRLNVPTICMAHIIMVVLLAAVIIVVEWCHWAARRRKSESGDASSREFPDVSVAPSSGEPK
jgi:hypothetical protein